MNIILVGFMGTGKTKVGRELARVLSWAFLDTDEIIEKELGLSIAEIFSSYGEKFFRRKEAEVIKKLVDKTDRTVVAVGGGAVLREDNRTNLRLLGTVVALYASPSEIARRLSGDSTRPLLQGGNLQQRIQELLAERKPYYELADVQIDTTGYSVREIVERVINLAGINRD